MGLPAARIIRAGKQRLHLLPVVAGLDSEGSRVERWLAKQDVTRLAIAISPEELEGLQIAIEARESKKKIDAEELLQLTELDVLYAFLLEAFGEASLPATCYLSAIQWAAQNEIEIIPTDVDHEGHADLFVEHVSSIDLMRQSLKLRKLRKKPEFPGVKNVVKFVRAWDDQYYCTKGLRNFRQAWEEKLAAGFAEAMSNTERLIGLVPLERDSGVRAHLRLVFEAGGDEVKIVREKA